MDAYIRFAVSKSMKTGAVYCLHESADVAHAFHPLSDRLEVELENTRATVLHTPSAPVGRPDLPGDAEANAAQLYASVHEKLLTLPDDLEIFPGHFAGSACGAGMSGKPSSTIGFVKSLIDVPRANQGRRA